MFADATIKTRGDIDFFIHQSGVHRVCLRIPVLAGCCIRCLVRGTPTHCRQAAAAQSWGMHGESIASQLISGKRGVHQSEIQFFAIVSFALSNAAIDQE